MWGELMMTAVSLLNRSPHSALGGATPYSKMHKKSPNLSRLRTIGARAFVHHERYRKKLEDRAFEGKPGGYGLDSQTYRVFNPANGTVVESRNVTFIESPPRSTPFQYSTEAHGYESDVLSYTSLLANPSAADELDFSDKKSGTCSKTILFGKSYAWSRRKMTSARTRMSATWISPRRISPRHRRTRLLESTSLLPPKPDRRRALLGHPRRALPLVSKV